MSPVSLRGGEPRLDLARRSRNQRGVSWNTEGTEARSEFRESDRPARASGRKALPTRSAGARPRMWKERETGEGGREQD